MAKKIKDSKVLFNDVKKRLSQIKNGETLNRTLAFDLFPKENYYGAKDKTIVLRINYNDEFEFADYFVAKDVMEDFYNKIINLKTSSKSWNYIYFIVDKYRDSEYLEFRYFSKIGLAEKPCKEYTSLMNYINKYWWGAYMRNFEFFSARMGGKRGRLWDEYGERYFLDNKPNKCSKILKELREMRGTKDILTCKRGEEDFMEDWERQHSEYYEVECEGEKRHYIELIIRSPKGKVKYQEKIY